MTEIGSLRRQEQAFAQLLDQGRARRAMIRHHAGAAGRWRNLCRSASRDRDRRKRARGDAAHRERWLEEMKLGPFDWNEWKTLSRPGTPLDLAARSFSIARSRCRGSCRTKAGRRQANCVAAGRPTKAPSSPVLWPIELGNAMLFAVRGRRSQPQPAIAALEALGQLPSLQLSVDAETLANTAWTRYARARRRAVAADPLRRLLSRTARNGTRAVRWRRSTGESASPLAGALRESNLLGSVIRALDCANGRSRRARRQLLVDFAARNDRSRDAQRLSRLRLGMTDARPAISFRRRLQEL